MNRIKLNLKIGFLFLLIDVIFWLLILISCINSPLDCADTIIFGPFFWYLPFTFFLSNGTIPIPKEIASSIIYSNFLIATMGGAMHFCFGYTTGLIIQKIKKLSPKRKI